VVRAQLAVFAAFLTQDHVRLAAVGAYSLVTAFAAIDARIADVTPPVCAPFADHVAI